MSKVGMHLNYEDINPKRDVFLGEAYLDIRDSEQRSVHLVKSFYVLEKDRFYHIFEYKEGTSLIHFPKEHFHQLEKYIDLSDEWTIFYKSKLQGEQQLVIMPYEYRLQYKNRF